MDKSPDRTAHTAAQQVVRRSLTNATPTVTLKQASRAIAMNEVYLQQFLECVTPRQLPEELRHKLANFFGNQSAQAGTASLADGHSRAQPSRGTFAGCSPH